MNALVPAFLLHRRPYREQDLLVDLFTPGQGRFRAVARRAQGRRSPHKALLQPFIPLQLSLFGRGELKTLGSVEAERLPLNLAGEHLFAGLYLNELLMRLLPQHEEQPVLFDRYRRALEALADGQEMEGVLRKFELSLLDALGYGIDFQYTAAGTAIRPDHYYRWQPEAGLVDAVLDPGAAGHWSGERLLALGQGELERPEIRQVARQLLRQALAPLLGSKPLASRDLLKHKRRLRSE